MQGIPPTTSVGGVHFHGNFLFQSAGKWEMIMRTDALALGFTFMTFSVCVVSSLRCLISYPWGRHKEARLGSMVTHCSSYTTKNSLTCVNSSSYHRQPSSEPILILSTMGCLATMTFNQAGGRLKAHIPHQKVATKPPTFINIQH